MSAKLYMLGETKVERAPQTETAFGCPRDFLGNRFVYVVISPRARGLSIGLNMNPDKFCNFDCVYCEVNRDVPPVERELDVSVMAVELEKTLFQIRSGGIRQLAGRDGLSPELLRLRHVAFSGDGEPTLCAYFAEAVQSVVHVRARGFPFFKMVLIHEWHLAGFVAGPRGNPIFFTRDDEIWIKLDAGTQAYAGQGQPQRTLSGESNGERPADWAETPDHHPKFVPADCGP